MQELKGKLLRNKCSFILKDEITAVAIIYILISITALVKDIFFASYLGTSQYADTLLLAFFLPDTVGNCLLAAAVGTSCVPVFSILFADGGIQRLRRCIINISVTIFIISLAITMALYFLKDVVADTLMNGLENEAVTSFQQLFAIFLPYIMLYPLVTIGASALQVQGRFRLAALPPVIFNMIFLGSILYSAVFQIPASKGVFIIAYSIAGASAAMALFVWTPHLRNSLKRVNSDGVCSPLNEDANKFSHLKDIFKVFVPFILILLSTQSIQYVERFLASRLDPGSVTGVNYAFRLSQVPVWVFAAAISVVVLPALSRSIGSGKEKEFKEEFLKYLKLVFLITVPIALIMFILRVPIISVLLKRGAFDKSSLQKTSLVLSGFSLSVIGQCIVYISLRAFMAFGKMLIPMVISFAAAAINITADILLVQKAGLSGLGYGSIIGAAFNAILIIYALHKRLNLDRKKLIMQLLRILLANTPLAVIAAAANKLWYTTIFRSGWGIQFFYLGISIFASFTVYYICVHNCKAIKSNI